MKRLVKTRYNIEPFQIYQIDDVFTVERDDVELYRTKHQHLTTRYCRIKLAEERNRKNEAIFQSIQLLKQQGIL